jgi:hypothetical protein
MYVVLRAPQGLFSILKIIRRGVDVYCIPPGVGFHYSLHESGESHFRYDRKIPAEMPPMVFMDGEAGVRTPKGIIRGSLADLGRAEQGCWMMSGIESPVEDYRKFTKSTVGCFVIELAELVADAALLTLGVWAVPRRNETSFWFNNRDADPSLVFRDTASDPQVWISAGSSASV